VSVDEESQCGDNGRYSDKLGRGDAIYLPGIWTQELKEKASKRIPDSVKEEHIAIQEMGGETTAHVHQDDETKQIP